MASGRALAEDAGLSVLEARGAARERDFAFGVARQLFEQPVAAAGEERARGAAGGAAAAAGPVVGDAGRRGVARGADPPSRALHGLYWLTVNLADRGRCPRGGRRPLGRRVNDAVPRLPRAPDRGLPVLLLAAARPADPDGEELWRELTSDPAAEILRPGLLSEPAVAQVLQAASGPRSTARSAPPATRPPAGTRCSCASSWPRWRPHGSSQTRTPQRPSRRSDRQPSAASCCAGSSGSAQPATELARAVAVLGETSDLPLAARAAWTRSRGGA